MRPFSTNFIFDEQEALLANPYLWGELPIHHVLSVDFWGRSPEQTIGSYRPLPNLLWRTLSWSFRFNTPWFLGFLNLTTHALTATLLVRALVGVIVPHGRLDSLPVRSVWLLGIVFVTNAVSTEAVTGVVGLADLLVGLSAAICLWALVWIERTAVRIGVLFFAIFLGCLSKETMLTLVFMLPVMGVAIFRVGNAADSFSTDVAPPLQNIFRGVFVGAIFVVAQLGAVLVRQRFFPTPVVAGRFSTGWTGIDRLVRWWSAPGWPHDELNNPLLAADTSERSATAAVIYLEQLGQFILPLEMSGDYSAPRQAVHGWDVWAMGGASLFALSSLWAGSVLLMLLAGRGRFWLKTALALSVVWVNSCFLPVSGAIVALPTIRAERLFYPASLGASLGVFLAVMALRGWWARSSATVSWRQKGEQLLAMLVIAFVGFQSWQARRHALSYSSDLAFWQAQVRAENPSAKSFLNLGVMLGARGDLDARLALTKRALEAAGPWPMGEIYLADTYCRRGELNLARPHYLYGLKAAPQSKSLAALSLQCIWDHGKFQAWNADLHKISDQHPDSWLDYLVFRIEQDGEENAGIPPEYRPRQYNRPTPSSRTTGEN